MITFGLAAISLILVLAGLAVIADHAARATAWRHIAQERRWNHEHCYHNQPPEPSTPRTPELGG